MTKAQTNGFQPDIVAAFVDRIELLQAELKEHTEGVQNDIAAVLEEASDHEGIPKKALRMVLRERALMRKVRELSQDDGTAYVQLCAALGDLDGTELGEAAKRLATTRRVSDRDAEEMRDAAKRARQRGEEIARTRSA